MTNPTRLLPSCLISELYAPWKDDPGLVAREVIGAAQDGFYRAVELAPVALAQDRATIRQVAAEHSLSVAIWLTSTLERDGLDICAVDGQARQRAVEGVKRLLPAARDCGADTVALVSGPDPGADQRIAGYESCRASLSEICAAASDLGLSVMMEPLDRFAHKKRLIGPTAEAVALFDEIRKEHPDFGLAFDSAHVALNGEDLDEAVACAKGQIVNLHLSNAVLDPTDSLYGDHHIPPGAPGFLTVDVAERLISRVAALNLHHPVRVAVEARAVPGDDPGAMAGAALAFLRAAFDRA